MQISFLFFFFIIFLTFYSPKDIHTVSSDLSGTGFDSKSSNHKQRIYYSNDSSDLPEEKEYPFLGPQHLLYLIINLHALIEYPSGFLCTCLLRSNSILKAPSYKSYLKNPSYSLLCVGLNFNCSVWNL